MARRSGGRSFEGDGEVPKHLRDLYSLFGVTGLPLEEAATALDLTILAAKTRLFRARAGTRRPLQGVWRGRGCEGTLGNSQLRADGGVGRGLGVRPTVLPFIRGRFGAAGG